MSIVVDLQLAVDGDKLEDPLPDHQHFQQWVEAALNGRRSEAELTIRVVEPNESQQLNHQYRGKDKPTNVLSFPFTAPPGITINLLGDLIICAKIVENEAKTQKKPIIAHWAHMVTHGCLHLLGYDHINTQEAEAMEHIEIAILHQQGFHNPYQTFDRIPNSNE